MKNKFQVGDRVKYTNDNDNIYTIMKIDGYFVHLDRGTTCAQACTFFELVERKIGDTWFKPDELYIHENALSLIDPEEIVHKTTGKGGVYRKMKEFDKNKCGHTNYEEKECEGEELNLTKESMSYVLNSMKNILKSEERKFKVDKLGWYERRDGEKVQVIDFKPEFNMSVVIYNKKSNELESYFPNGTKTGISYLFSIKDLTKYLGLELPKEHRKFEFEGYICEYPNTEDKYKPQRDPIENNFSYRVSNLYTKEYANERLQQIIIEKGFISKWKITMEEIIE